MGEDPQPARAQNEPRSPAEHAPFDISDIPMLCVRLGRWCRANPVQAVLFAGLLGVMAYFYFGLKAFMALGNTAAQWMTSGWNEENDQEHCWAVVPVALLLVVLRWREIEALPKKGANSGLWFVGLGVLLYVAGVRCAEARYTIFALPPLFYGATRFLWGAQVARTVIFPCVFLLFMVPVGGVVQGTVPLQLLTAKAIRLLSSIFGIPIIVDGSTLSSPDGRFEPMEIAGGCSGIRSLMAMTMLAALYAYFTSRGPVRGFILFCFSIVFAVVGNFARVFSVVLFARFLDPATATGLYHDYSGLVFFPVAVGAMAGMGSLLNRDWAAMLGKWKAPLQSGPQAGGGASTGSPPDAQANPRQAPYDY